MKGPNPGLLAAATLLSLCLTTSTNAQSVGAPFGARDPHNCPNAKQPAKGAPSPAQAKEYVTCEAEHVAGSSLFLAENVTVEVGKGQPFNAATMPFASDADTSALVYPIRGSYTEYSCGHVHSGPYDYTGKNCTVTPKPKAEGHCYKTAFGDWYCAMRDLNVNYSAAKANQPPPK